MLRQLEPHAARLDRQFQKWLRQARIGTDQQREFLAITPAGAARIGSLGRFRTQVERSGRALAKWNIAPATLTEALEAFDQLADKILDGQFAPAREQLRLATHFVLTQTFFAVRETESQAFFGLYQAETHASDLDDLLARYVQVLARAFHASAARLVMEVNALPAALSRPLYAERGDAAEDLIAGRGWLGRYACYWSYPFGDSGVLQLGFRERARWLPREEALLAAAAARCQLAVERARAALEIRRLQAEALRAEEEERRRIGRDLHDEAGQTLAFLRLQLDMLARDVPEDLHSRVIEARDVAAHAAIELRRIVAALSPSVLERLGLETALRQLANRFRGSHPAEIQFRAPAFSGGLPRHFEEVIYRVAQESLQNVAKHSGATRVKVSLQNADNKIKLSVRDNGAGFSAEKAWCKPTCFGLAGMRERALLLGGTLAIDSAPGKGTYVTLELPAPVIPDAKNSRFANG